MPHLMIAGKAAFYLLWIALLTFNLGLGFASADASGPQRDEKCDIHHSTCTQRLGDREVTLDIRPKPVRAMTDLVFTVAISGKKLSKNPHIDLGMPGMKMGPNRVRLKATGSGLYEGKGVIVRCPSGRRTWEAVVTLPDCGNIRFVFDVIY